jgi:HD-GYP domain-containing protein (c-di-GMP phosphodiesterase class II)
MHRQHAHAIKNAKDIINRLAIILRIGQTYSVDNQAFISAVNAFVEIVNTALVSETKLDIELLGEYFYLNRAPVRYSIQYYLNFDFLISEFRKRGLGRITVSGTICRLDLQVFMKAFLSCLSSDSPFTALKGGIDTIDSIDIGVPKQGCKENIVDSRRMLKKQYFNGAAHLRFVMKQIKEGERIEIKKARLVVNSLIDHVLQDEQTMIRMTAIKDYDDYTYYHAVNVSILSIGLGMKLGLSKKRLSELGIAAFLHDIGKVNIPKEILNKENSFTDAEWNIMKQHPSEGVKIIMRTMKMEPMMIRGAIVSYEHHNNYDGSGYPSVPHQHQLDLYSKIVTIADRFDAMTSARVYSRVPKSPEKALQILVEGAGKDVDPLLLKMFIKLVGVFPIGTLVALDNDELGIVYKGNADEPERPQILLVVDSQGRKIENTLVDLAEKGLDGNYRRSIKTTLDYNKYNLNLAEFLL